MTAFDFEQLREGKKECPSDMTLWRLHHGELAADEEKTLRDHVATCADCGAGMARRSAGFDAFPEADARRMLAAIRRGVAEPKPSLGARWLRALRFVLAPLVVAGAAVLVVHVRPHGGLVADDAGGRVKGGPVLHVFRASGADVREVISGDRFRPGDRLRFAVDLAAESRVQIIGVEATGRIYPVWPADSSAVQLPAGKGQAVPGAVELDESPGTERLYVIACAPEETQPSCTSRGAIEPPTCKAGCETGLFVLVKGT